MLRTRLHSLPREDRHAQLPTHRPTNSEARLGVVGLMGLSLRRQRATDVVVPAFPDTANGGPEPVYCTIDGSESSSASLDQAIAQCKASGAGLELVWASGANPATVNDIQKALIAAVRTAREAGVPVRVAPPG